MVYRVPLTFTPQPEGGYTVTSSVLPELITEGDTLTEAQENARDALAAVVELYADTGRTLPSMISQSSDTESIESDALVEVG